MLNFNKKKFFIYLKNRDQKNKIILSKAYGAFCEMIKLDKNQEFVIKSYTKKNTSYNPVYYEGLSTKFMNKNFPSLYPKVYFLNNNLFVMQYITHNKIKDKNSEKDFAKKLSKIHKQKNNKFGFKYDTPIGGFRQPNSFQKSWLDFYEKKRLLMIYEKINKTHPMPKKINRGVEKVLKNLKNLIPNNPQPSLIHGDLWKENMLFNNGKLVGLIDPGIYYAHKEMEIAYLKWLKTISKKFYNYYSEYANFDKDFFKYTEVYELYFSLLNVHLWNRKYIHNVAKLINRFI